jgi:molybdopterin-synthase adenylyltransferase
MITPTTSIPSDRFSRQADLVPQEKLTDLTATVIGLGAVGRQVALQLAAIGVRRLQLYDFDDVEPTNISTQGYGHGDLGLPKVLATAQAISRIGPDVIVTPIPDRFRPRHNFGEAVFCCVDKIAAREAIWRCAGKSCLVWADGRMLGETLRVLSASKEEERRHYGTTLFPAAEAEQGRCTARSTIYVANLCAALTVHQFTRWLRGLPLDRELALNLLASEMIVAGEGQV